MREGKFSRFGLTQEIFKNPSYKQASWTKSALLRHHRLLVLEENDERLRWVKPERAGGCSEAEIAAHLQARGGQGSEEDEVSIDALDPTQQAKLALFLAL